MAKEKDSAEIPGPPGLPFVGNSLAVDIHAPLVTFTQFAEQYGPACRVSIGGSGLILISSVELLDELCDEKRFHKVVTSAVGKLQEISGDGLFTANHGQHSWGVAHRILMPVLGPLKIREMFPPMKDIAQQLCLKWARLGDEYVIPVADDLTRLTLDTLALCTMDYRFNSFYTDGTHSFIKSMVGLLTEAGVQATKPAIVNAFRLQARREFDENNQTMRDIGMQIIQARRDRPVASPDLLNALLYGRDPKTGEGLSDNSIIDQMITFLVAGHETTSGLLSFAFFYMLDHPDTLKKAQQEVDQVVGNDAVTVEHLGRLPYINAVLRETLRLQPTAPAFVLGAFEDTTLGGRYRVKKEEPMLALLHKIHRDPAVYGDDAEVFRPERMLDENMAKLPKNAWKPFGNGARACIGRAFAWQEAQLVLALLLGNFDFRMADPAYELRVKHSLTIKPDGFTMRASLRRHRNPTELLDALGSGGASTAASAARPQHTDGARDDGRPLAVFHGSNSGTCEALAYRLAADAPSKGFAASAVQPLDSAVDNLPTDMPVVIVTASYDGQPADNAAGFVKWLEGLAEGSLEGVSYAVFGCGHRDWAATFYRIPTLVDELLAKAGGKRLAPRGTADSSVSDMFSDLEAWQEAHLWPALSPGAAAGADDDAEMIRSKLQLRISKPRRVALHESLMECVVTESRALTAAGHPLKMHLELKLPDGAAYQPGDHIQVLPTNPRPAIECALVRFGLSWDSLITIDAAPGSKLPTESLIAGELLGSYVELAQPATPRDLRILAAAATDDATKAALTSLATTSAPASTRAKRPSILTLLTTHPTIALPFATFLSLLPPLRPRTYSISSAPHWHPHHATLTVSVLDPPTALHPGVASTYLTRSTPAGATVYAAPRPAKPSFHLPADAAEPVVMVAAGSGVAPFVGFAQGRALAARAGAAVGPALLLFGCRRRGADDLYREELGALEREGAVVVRRAYSRDGGDDGFRGYVQELVREGRAEVEALWRKGARVYVCGSPRMAGAVKEVFVEMAYEVEREAAAGREASEWFKQYENGRYSAEIFA
ncbi:hypothetical protein Trco_000025 [Neofusicoccum parvum]|nr:hypothetical protein Trco_000025 [Neofusicoccum parvum]